MIWVAIPIEPDQMHIVPKEDYIEHELSYECVCGPTVTPIDSDWKMITHNSLDGREFYESYQKG